MEARLGLPEVLGLLVTTPRGFAADDLAAGELPERTQPVSDRLRLKTRRTKQTQKAERFQ